MKDELALLQAAAQGNLDSLPCPQCGKTSVSIFFTHPAEDQFRTWCVCKHCGYRLRAQNNGRPAFFTESRVVESLEECDRNEMLAVEQIMKRVKSGPT